MGLDITAYSFLEYVASDDACSQDEGEERNYIHIYEEGFNRLDGCKPGWYTRTEGTATHAFRAGSYGGYNHWREQLCQAMLGARPALIWEAPDLWEGGPFVELINFSDCEGALGPVTSAKLLQDCALLLKEAPSFPLLAHWHKAFWLASHRGFVKFH